MPEMEMWSANQTPDGVPRWGLEAPRGTIARVGINFGAPGGRQAANGTLWTPFPPTDAPAPELRARLNTLDYDDTPVRIIMVSGSSAGAGDTLDGEPSSAWAIRSNREGRFDEWLQYDLNTVATLDQVSMTWSGPAATQFRIEVSEDGLQWTTVSESAGSGEGRDEPVVYRFDPVRARHVRLVFDAHGRQRRDRLSVFEARLGGLADPAAYAYFRPVNGFYRQPVAGARRRSEPDRAMEPNTRAMDGTDAIDLSERTWESVDENGDENGLRVLMFPSSTAIVAVIVNRSLLP